jgi:hypothetical protein
MKDFKDQPPKLPKQKTCIHYLKSLVKPYCKKKQQKTKTYYINKWRKYLNKEAQTTQELNDPFELLTHLWAHKNVLHELEGIRLNPNLLNKNKIRNDLEFYIPQLW